MNIPTTEVHYTQAFGWNWPNFTPREIACKGTGLVLIDPHSMDCLQKFREIVGVPVIINSGYRSEAHNRAVGGAKNSQHRLGKAFDIRITDALSREQIHKAGKQAGFKAFGDYGTFVHMDTRATPAYWDER